MSDFSLWDIVRNLLTGLQWTLLLSLVAFIGGGVIGLLVMAMRISHKAFPRNVARTYIELFQGTPLLMQLFLVFFGVALLGVDISPWLAAAIALTLFTSAYLAEIWRGCVDSISHGQWEASASLALNPLEQLRYVILPQALRIAVAPTVGFSVQVVKGTAVTSIIGFTELTKTGGMLANATFEPFMVYGLVALGYFLHKYYGDHHVLKGIDLTVEEGQVVAIIGRSGSGKSTLLRTLNGLESINDGVIEVDGEYLDAARADLRSLRQKVGMVFQQFNLFPHLTVGENVMLAPQVVQKVPKAKAAQLARQMLERVGLGEKFDAFPDRLSGGQQQRVAIARALAMSPKVLLCDEITSALDPELVNEVLSVVRQLANDGMTLIMVTHEMRFAREVGDKLVFMHQGKVHEVGDPKVLFANPQTPELANFIGSVEQPG
jgi:polar amino acid transport system ATP-binding protein